MLWKYSPDRRERLHLLSSAYKRTPTGVCGGLRGAAEQLLRVPRVLPGLHLLLRKVPELPEVRVNVRRGPVLLQERQQLCERLHVL